VVPSVEVRIVPLSPTTYKPLEVVELLDVLLFLAQEIMVRLKQEMRIMYKTLFIFVLHQ
jgi:hypothetical protein